MKGFGEVVNLNPSETANAVVAIITCKVEPWKIVAALLTFFLSSAENNRIQLSAEVCGKGIAYSSEPVRATEQISSELPPAPE